MTPYRPKPASSSARAAKPAISVALKRGVATDCARYSSSVRISPAARSGSSRGDRLTQRRRQRIRSPVVRTTAARNGHGVCTNGRVHLRAGASLRDRPVLTSPTMPTISRGPRCRSWSAACRPDPRPARTSQRHRLVDDRHRRRLLVVALGEAAAAQQRNAHRREILRADREPGRRRTIAGSAKGRPSMVNPTPM